MRPFLTLTFLVSLATAHAADRYIRPGAAGNGTGADWTNAYPALPNPLARGDTYWLADGDYGSYTFDDAGTSLVTLRKATPGAHGSSVGWNDAYGDGQALFSGLRFEQGHILMDGARRNEADWTDSVAYGFRVRGDIFSSRLDSGACADELTFRYVDVGGPVGTGIQSANGSGLYLGGFGGGSLACENWTLHRGHVHNTIIPIQCAGCSGLLVEYTHFGVSWGKEAIRGQVQAANNTVRHSFFKDSCQKDPEDATSGCTAEIAMWDDPADGAFSGNRVYGNVFQKTTLEHNSGGVIVIGGNGTSWVGSPASNTLIYNNTLVGFQQGTAMILVNGGTGNVVKNNIWFDIGSGVSTNCAANTCESNTVYTSISPFVSYPGTMMLSGPTLAGSVLGAPYDTDLRGTTRGADGVWDRGAYEYASESNPTPPAAPRGLRLD